MKKDGGDGTHGYVRLFPDDLLEKTKKKALEEKDTEDGSNSKTIASLYDQQEEDLCEIIAVLIADQIICSTMLRWVLWVKYRSQSFTNITAFWNNLERKRNFRVNRTTFQHLCTELSGKLQHASTVRAAVSAETRVAIALWQLATNVEYRTIFHLFGVGFRQLVSSFMKYAGQ